MWFKILENLISSPENLVLLSNEYESLLQARDDLRVVTNLDMDQKLYLPVNIARILQTIKLKNKNIKVNIKNIANVWKPIVKSQIGSMCEGVFVPKLNHFKLRLYFKNQKS